jgi:glutaredoxin
VADLVAFCSGWASRPEPARALGVWVLLFLGVFTADRLAPERRLLERHQVDRAFDCAGPGGQRAGAQWLARASLRALFFEPLKALRREPAMMVLYSGTTCPYSHRCRFVLFEKGMDFEIRDVDLFAKPEDIALMNPYNEVPILVERDLILYESHIINEYIDERFPHPQLMPGDPVARARVRLFLFNFEKELFAHVNMLEGRVA